MYLALGALSGALAGTLAWLIAGAFVAHHHDEAVDLRALLRDARGAVSPYGAALVAAFALVGAFVGWRASSVACVVAALVVSALFASIAIIDLRVRRIPNALVLALLAWGLVQVLWLGQPTILSAVLGALLGGGVFLLLALLRRGAMGAGDVKLAAAIGFLTGFPLVLTALFWGIVAGGIAALLLLITRRAGRKDAMAYGPYLALGGWLIYLGMLGLLPWGAIA